MNDIDKILDYIAKNNELNLIHKKLRDEENSSSNNICSDICSIKLLLDYLIECTPLTCRDCIYSEMSRMDDKYVCNNKKSGIDIGRDICKYIKLENLR